jgi:hypothetical protein
MYHKYCAIWLIFVLKTGPQGLFIFDIAEKLFYQTITCFYSNLHLIVFDRFNGLNIA